VRLDRVACFIVKPQDGEKCSKFDVNEMVIRGCVDWFDKFARFFRNSPDMKTRIPQVLIIFAVVCFGLFANARAVSPTPDGCYPNFTTAEGCDALRFLTTGAGNTGLGWRSLFLDSAGNLNTAVGAGALALNNADSNTAVGAAALLANTSGTENTATGTEALASNDTGIDNTAYGAFAIFNNTAGDGNTAVGTQVLLQNTTGSQNTAVGTLALVSNTTGRNNIALGFEAGSGVAIADNVICIGAGVVGDNVDNSCFIGNIATSTSPNGIALLINSTGGLGTITSSARFKDEIQPMDKASEALFALKPVAFRYKKDIDPARTPQLGLVAEDVEKVNPDLIVRDKEGKPYSVRYEQVNAMLLNEFLKEHKTVNEQGAMIARQQKAIEARCGLSEGERPTRRSESVPWQT
jgi:hypothetical protein